MANGRKTGGRVAGTPNRRTLEWEQFRDHCLTGGLTRFKTEMDKLKERDYVDAFIKLLEYHKPKLARTVDQDGNDAKGQSITVTLTNDRGKNTDSV